MALNLFEINEFDALRRFESLPDLLAANTATGQCELIAGSALPASALHAGSVGEKAGNPIPDWWNTDPPIACNPVQLFRVRDAFYAPGFGAVIAPDGAVMAHTVGQARVQNLNLSALPYAAEEDEQVIFRPPDDVPHLPAGIVSMPWAAIYNYGHFVCDCLTSLALLSHLPGTDAYPRVFPTLKPWHRRHMELLGVAPIELDQPLYRIADVLFTNGIWQFINAPNINYRTLRDIQLRNKRAADVATGRIYITRSRITQAERFKRRFLSEAALEERLRALGFAIVAPELLDIDEQIDLFRNAELIVSCRGAALANVIYCRPDTAIVEIVATIAGFEDYQWVRDICAIIGCRWRPYFCAGIPPENPVIINGKKRPNAGFTFDVDVPDLVGFIERSMQRPHPMRA
jgi:capsular polysaccharide biosynthesis protein